MGTKREELLDPSSCFSKAGLDEHLFVLRAKDLYCAVPAIKAWIIEARRQSKHEDHREATAAYLDDFVANGIAIEGGLPLEKHTPRELMKFLVNELAPEMVQRMMELETIIKRQEELEAKRLEHAIGEAARDIFAKDVELPIATAALALFFPSYKPLVIEDRIIAKVGALEQERIATEEAEQRHAAAIAEAAAARKPSEPPAAETTAHTQPPAPGPQDPPVPPNHHPVA